jgi:hypothetical protein
MLFVRFFNNYAVCAGDFDKVQVWPNICHTATILTREAGFTIQTSEIQINVTL